MWAVYDEKTGRQSLFTDLKSASAAAARWFRPHSGSRVFVARVKQEALLLIAQSDTA